MSRRSCDGAGLLKAFRSAVANLEANVEEINALNVFPVPDGDTGTNMLATVRAALDEADRTGGVAEADRVAAAARLGALMGARGNSGVITSQILAGIADGLVGKRRFNGLDLAHALDAGTKMAYKAVTRPVEGTILTVIREASAAAVAAAERDNDVESVLAATVDAAERAVAKTPSLLAVLREAGVVDSGGQGLFRLMQGALEAARGRPVDGTAGAPSRPASEARPTVESTASGAGDGEYGYETVYLLKAREGHLLDLPAIAAHLEALGDSVLVAGDPHLVKVHVHNDRPDAVIAYGLTVGALSRITIENLDGQAHEVREAKAAAFIGSAGDADATGKLFGSPSAVGTITGPAAANPRAATRLPLGIVAVVPSDGLEHLFAQHTKGLSEFVSVRIVRGGQSANPSTGELLAAVADTPADEILLLPNNPNVILAARQVAEMADRPIHVVPTRNCAEGLASLLGLDPSDPADENMSAMTRASREVQTLQVTEAVRDATVSGKKVKKGQTIALDPDDGLIAVDNDPHKAVLAAMARLEPGYSIVTIYYGEDSSLDDAEGLRARVSESNGALEDVDVQVGGQPHYRYLIAAE